LRRLIVEPEGHRHDRALAPGQIDRRVLYVLGARRVLVDLEAQGAPGLDIDPRREAIVDLAPRICATPAVAAWLCTTMALRPPTCSTLSPTPTV